MANFQKIIKKTVRPCTHCLAIKMPDDIVYDLLEVFDTVFAINDSKKIKHRSIVYREDYNSLSNLPEIKMILCQPGELINLSKLLPIVSKSKPLFCFLTGEHSFDLNLSREFAGVGYEPVSRRKQYQLWQHKGKRKK